MKTFIFNHIERCGGTSLRISLFDEFSKLYDPKDIYISYCNYSQNASIELNQNIDLTELRNKKVFADHSCHLAIERAVNRAEFLSPSDHCRTKTRAHEKKFPRKLALRSTTMRERVVTNDTQCTRDRLRVLTNSARTLSHQRSAHSQRSS